MSKQGQFGGERFPSSTGPQGNHEAYGAPWDLPPKRQAQGHRGAVPCIKKDEEGPWAMPMRKRYAKMENQGGNKRNHGAGQTRAGRLGAVVVEGGRSYRGVDHQQCPPVDKPLRKGHLTGQLRGRGDEGHKVRIEGI